LDITITGRRPNLSDSAPCKGENKNCIKAHPVPKHAENLRRLCVCRRRNRLTSFGNTGMTMPMASMSENTVAKMKDEGGLAPRCADFCRWLPLSAFHQRRFRPGVGIGFGAQAQAGSACPAARRLRASR
jgi:hypothetical protein